MTVGDRPVLIGRLVLLAVVAAVVVEVLRVHGGVAGTELASSWQLLDLRILEDDPISGVWYLHTQPPLHNLVIGLAAWSPLPLAGTVFVLFVVALLVIGFGLHDLLLRWGVPVAVATLAAGLAVADPALLSTIRIASYEVPLAALLVAFAWVLDRYLEGPTPRRLAAVVGVALALVLTRALFHPVWLALVLAVVLLARRPTRRQVVLTVAVPAVLLGGLIVKNAVIVDSASLSSWSGFNLQRGVLGPMSATSVDDAISDGAVTSLAAQPPWLALDAYAPWLDGCRPVHDQAALRDPSKTVRTVAIPNFNAECYVGLYRQSRDNALTMIRREPGQYVGDRVLAVGMSFTYTPLGHDEAPGSLLGEPLPSTSWMDRLFSVLMVRQGVDVDMRAWNVPLYGDSLRIELAWPLVIAFLIVLGRAVLAAVRCWRRRREAVPSREVVWLVAGLTVAFVVIGGDLVEFGENGRFRSMLDPLVFGLVAVAITDALRRRRPATDG